MLFPKQVFVTGTDTNVGKTVVSAMLTLGLQGIYWKPIQSGRDPETDTAYIQRVTQLDSSHFIPEKFCLTHPLSPHLAAELDGVTIQLSDFYLPEVSSESHLIVEGAGGLLVPFNKTDFIIDLIAHLSLPVCLVARTQLGTINHTLLSIEALRKREISILGVILNGSKNQPNREAIANYGSVPILGELEPLDPVHPPTLIKAFDRLFNQAVQF
jgi:dethiobiotin synthetase